MDKPKIFISSTIYDFKDLRSSLKFYLESLGHQVLLSEFNDFTKDLNKNSFEACLQTIGQVDYYVLFVGSRVGGFYDRSNQISITQKEYRTAYELAKSGRLKMLMFVRKELWEVRSDRESLKKFIEKDFRVHHEISDEEISEIALHQSEFANDAGFMFNFIDEITRKEEMKTAISQIGQFPPANWVHTFSNFVDIVDAITVEFGLKNSLTEVALRVNLKHELSQNLMMMCTKTPAGDIFFFHDYASSAWNFFSGDLKGDSLIPSKHLISLSLFFIFGFSRQTNIQTKLLEYALISGQFLEYDLSTNDYRSSKIDESLKQLNSYIGTYQSMCKSIEPQKYALIEQYASYPQSEQNVRVRNLDIIFAFVAYACLCNIKELIIGILKALDGEIDYLNNVSLTPLIHQNEMTERAKRDTVTRDDIDLFIKFHH